MRAQDHEALVSAMAQGLWESATKHWQTKLTWDQLDHHDKAQWFVFARAALAAMTQWAGVDAKGLQSAAQDIEYEWGNEADPNLEGTIRLLRAIAPSEPTIEPTKEN